MPTNNAILLASPLRRTIRERAWCALGLYCRTGERGVVWETISRSQSPRAGSSTFLSKPFFTQSQWSLFPPWIIFLGGESIHCLLWQDLSLGPDLSPLDEILYLEGALALKWSYCFRFPQYFFLLPLNFLTGGIHNCTFLRKKLHILSLNPFLFNLNPIDSMRPKSSQLFQSRPSQRGREISKKKSALPYILHLLVSPVFHAFFFKKTLQLFCNTESDDKQFYGAPKGTVHNSWSSLLLGCITKRFFWGQAWYESAGATMRTIKSIPGLFLFDLFHKSRCEQ